MAGIVMATVYEGGEFVVPTTCVCTISEGGGTSTNIVEATLPLFLRLMHEQAAIATTATIITTISITPAINNPSPINLISAEERKTEHENYTIEFLLVLYTKCIIILHIH